jgi:hypothetical protein
VQIVRLLANPPNPDIALQDEGSEEVIVIDCVMIARDSWPSICGLVFSNIAFQIPVILLLTCRGILI